MKGEHSCELLDEDRFHAPDDLVEEQGYEYYGMSRKYEKTVRKHVRVMRRNFRALSPKYNINIQYVTSYT